MGMTYDIESIEEECRELNRELKPLIEAVIKKLDEISDKIAIFRSLNEKEMQRILKEIVEEEIGSHGSFSGGRAGITSQITKKAYGIWREEAWRVEEVVFVGAPLACTKDYRKIIKDIIYSSNLPERDFEFIRKERKLIEKASYEKMFRNITKGVLSEKLEKEEGEE